MNQNNHKNLSKIIKDSFFKNNMDEYLRNAAKNYPENKEVLFKLFEQNKDVHFVQELFSLVPVKIQKDKEFILKVLDNEVVTMNIQDRCVKSFGDDIEVLTKLVEKHPYAILSLYKKYHNVKEIIWAALSGEGELIWEIHNTPTLKKLKYENDFILMVLKSHIFSIHYFPKEVFLDKELAQKITEFPNYHLLENHHTNNKYTEILDNINTTMLQIREDNLREKFDNQKNEDLQSKIIRKKV